jgi:hypothetical protein
VLVLGGYGAFGVRIAERLARQEGLEVVVAGRSLERAKTAAQALRAAAAHARIAAVGLDASQATERDIRDLRAVVLINAAGPFQGQDYRVARSCIAAGTHYIDLADARAFVCGISALDAAARRAGTLVVSGASTVPAVAAAAIEALIARLASPREISIVISPGNRFDPGLATTQSILGTLGRPLAAGGGARPRPVHGWQGLRRVMIPGLGARWASACETPDLDLLPQRYPGLAHVEVLAALEVGAFHLGLWGLSWLVRAGMVRAPERLAASLLGLKRALRLLGSDAGGMMVALRGEDGSGGEGEVVWRLIARRGQGPYIPGVPSVMLAKRLVAGTLAQRGALPCLGLFTLADVLAEVADLDMDAAVVA